MLPFSDTLLPLMTISDDAFALTTKNMKPYPDRNLTEDQNLFNYMLSRNRRVVECCFGILAKTWQVIYCTIWRDPRSASKIVLSLIAIHNFIREDNIKNQKTYDLISENEVNHILVQHFESVPSIAGRSSNEAKQIRDTLKDYFKLHYGSR